MKRRAPWFLAAVVFQFIVVLAVPLEGARVRATGRTVHVRMAGVDPYSILSGYYVALRYPWNERPDGRRGERVCAVLTRPKAGALYVFQRRAPAPLENPGEDTVSICGRSDAYGNVRYGIERFHVPEAERIAIDQHIASLVMPLGPEATPEMRATVAPIVELKVTDGGTALVTALWVDGTKYAY